MSTSVRPQGEYRRAQPEGTPVTLPSFGISGFAVHVPTYRVSLKDWCQWTGSDWDKTRAVIGHSFRVAGPQHSVYTLAANAALQLILDHDIDPQRVGYLAVGTESSTDNATSAALVVRGLLDQALRARGLPPLARDLEAPEFKQACIGGVYALKGALRYLAVEGSGRTAIVIAADIAEYARGSSGEPTQGAGAVAMLVEAAPKLLAIDLRDGASASSYRALDFRKPFLRYCGQVPGADGRPRDFPVFNGKYSTACYVDATIASLSALLRKQGGEQARHLRELGAVFMHRPYHRMPVAAWSLAYLFALGADASHSPSARDELAGYAAAAGLALDEVLREMGTDPQLLPLALQGLLTEEPYPLCARLVKALRESPVYRQVVDDKMTLGSHLTVALGNLYCASLPAWLAAGLEDAAQRQVHLPGDRLLLVGYGSGDASEALPATLVPGWQAAALRTGFAARLDGAIDLDRHQYETLHAGHLPEGLPPDERSGFVVSRIGTQQHGPVLDYGIEYHHEQATCAAMPEHDTCAS